jgi:predicted Zn-dependent peptidase
MTLEIAHERRVLPCGLDVIVHPDPSSPQVCASIWYRVGSSDEQPERTGFAHLFEHVFKNSLHVPSHHYEILRRAGSSEANASTDVDRTGYYEVVPAHELALALWLESDRMGYFWPGMTAERLRQQQEVVVAERTRRYETVPYGAERFAVARALYPDGHPLRHLTIGLTEHIEAATMSDVEAFYRTWYVPANAILVIAGDVEPARAFDEVDRYFGSFPASRRPERRMVAARVTPSTDRVSDPLATLRRMHRVWLGPAAFADDEAELDLATAAWSATGTGTLWRRLVYETQLAQRVSTWTTNGRLGGEIHVAVDLKPGADDAAVRAILDEELARPVAADAITRAATRHEAGAVWSLASLVRRAQMLQRYALYTDEPDGLAADLARYAAVTTESANAAVARWVSPDAMIEVETALAR